jgi:superfamily II RNA helicase
MAGRSGRAGHDKVGTVIHLNNLYRNIDISDYKNMMSGKPQTLISKFKLSYNLLLNLIYNKEKNLLSFVEKSMIYEDINKDLENINDYMKIKETKLNSLYECIKVLRTPLDVCKKHIECIELRKTAINKKRNELDKKIKQSLDENKCIEEDVKTVISYNNTNFEFEKEKEDYHKTRDYLKNNINLILEFLKKNGFIAQSILCQKMLR